jgi:threonine dehydratase
MWPLVQKLLDGALSATLADTAAVIHRLIRLHHVVAEGAGAALVAAALGGVPGEGPVVCVVSGGHLDPKHIIAVLSEHGHVPTA